MVRYCSVPKCKSKCTDKGVSFHYFPKDVFFRTEWVVKLKIAKDPSKYSQVCSLHFEENDFIYSINYENVRRRRLRDHVVPSKLLPHVTEEGGGGPKVEDKEAGLMAEWYGPGEVRQDGRTPSPESPKPSPNQGKPFVHFISRVTEDTSQPPTPKEEPSKPDNNPSQKRSSKTDTLRFTSPKVLAKEVLLQTSNGQLIPYRLSQPPSQTEKLKVLHEENHLLKAQLLALQKECEQLKEENNKLRYRVDALDDARLRFYTGYSREDFHRLFTLLSSSPHLITLERPKLAPKDELLLVLMKLRHGFRLEDLAYRFGLNFSATSYTFHKWLNIINAELGSLISLPSPTDPSLNASSCVVGFIELSCTCSQFCKLTRSTKDSEHIFKLLVALFPTGLIGFISPTYSVQTPERDILLSSGFLNNLRPNFEILIDKDLATQQSLLSSRSKLTIVLSRRPASKIAARIKKEFHLIQERFKLLKSTLPRNYVEKNGRHSILDKLLRICIALHNQEILSTAGRDLPTSSDNNLEEYLETSEMDVISFLDDAYDMSQIGENLLSSEAIEKILQPFETGMMAEKAEDSLSKNLTFLTDSLDW